MSKIQDALRKIQSVKPPVDKPAATSAPDELPLKPMPDEIVADEPLDARRSIGLVVDELDATGVRIQPNDGGLVVVDSEMLREAGYLAPVDQERNLAEEYRMLKRPLLNNASGRGPDLIEDGNLIMVTSALPGDGKTFNCINLAMSMAVEKDVSVLLVDADVAKQHVSQLFGIDQKPGLTDLLKDKSKDVDSVVLRTDIPGLRILSAGSRDEHANELLASRRMEEVLAELSSAYSDRIVIFDSPPILVTSEAYVLANQMGQIVMVVCAARTPQKAVVDALEGLDESKPINLIFNQSSSRQAGGEYGSYHYGYGSKPADGSK